MTQILMDASFWYFLALIATVISLKLRVAIALSEIMVGMVASLIITTWLGSHYLTETPEWIKFLAGAGAIMLTFLAGSELDPDIFKKNWKEASAIGISSFLIPFLGCTAIAYYGLNWNLNASWLTGIALSTTSVAVVYAVMLEFELNKTTYGKTLLAACFVTDLGTVLALGFMFAPFTWKTLVFFVSVFATCFILPRIVKATFKVFGNLPSEYETKFLLFFLFLLGAIAAWSGSEAVLPAYIMGMILAGTIGKDHHLIRRLRTLTFGFLTPLYFIRAGSYVSIPALIGAPIIILVLLIGKMVTKIIGVYPLTKVFGSPNGEGMYTTLLMSTGLTFGSISALFGLNHGIIDGEQYSYLIAVIIGSAVIPTLIANAFYLPHHLITKHKDNEANTLAQPSVIQEIQKEGVN